MELLQYEKSLGCLSKGNEEEGGQVDKGVLVLNFPLFGSCWLICQLEGHVTNDPCYAPTRHSRRKPGRSNLRTEQFLLAHGFRDCAW